MEGAAAAAGAASSEGPQLAADDPHSIVADTAPPSYIIEWGGNTPCARTPLDVDSVAAQAVHTAASTPAAKARALASSHKLVVLRGTGIQEASDRLCDALDVDPGFLAAHTEGRRYRRRGWRRGMSGDVPAVESATYTYPQTSNLLDSKVRDERPVPRRAEADTDSGIDTEDHQRRPDSASTADRRRDGLVEVFCRVSLWETAHTSVLLLDDSPSSTTFEDVLVDTLNDSVHRHSSAIAAGMAHAVVAQFVHDQWLDLFDTITAGGGTRQPHRVHATKTMCRDMAWFLEQNLVASRLHDKAARQTLRERTRGMTKLGGLDAVPPTDPPPAYELLDSVDADDWKELLARLDRMVPLLSLHPDREPRLPAESSAAVKDVPGGIDDSAMLAPGTEPPLGATPRGQNDLNRVTYMGGILLPFSIIAGIMSMSDPYGPGDSMFWIYWAVTLPITCLFLVIIYADNIRNTYVWQLISYERFQKAVGKGEAVPLYAEGIVPSAGIRMHSHSCAVANIEMGTDASAVRLGTPPGSVSNVNLAAEETGHTYLSSAGLEPCPYTVADIETGTDASAVRLSGIDLRTATVRRRHHFHIPNPMRLFQTTSDWSRPTTVSRHSVTIDTGQHSHGRLAEAAGRRIPVRNIAVPGYPAIMVQHGPDGTQRLYRRQKLGWAGAFKSMVGYHRPREA